MLKVPELTRFPNGVNNQAEASIFNGLPFPYRGDYYVFDEEFWEFTAAQWTETDVAGTNTVAATEGHGGRILLTTGATENNGVQIQRVASGVAAENVLLDPAKKFFFETIFQCNDVDQSDILIGLCITDTSLIAALSDGIFLRSADEAATLTVVAEKGSAEVESDSIGTLVDATDHRVRLFYDGQGASGRLYYEFDGTVVGYITPGDSFPDDELLTPSISILTGEGAAQTLNVDRLFFAVER